MRIFFRQEDWYGTGEDVRGFCLVLSRLCLVIVLFWSFFWFLSEGILGEYEWGCFGSLYRFVLIFSLWFLYPEMRRIGKVRHGMLGDFGRLLISSIDRLGFSSC